MCSRNFFRRGPQAFPWEAEPPHPRAPGSRDAWQEPAWEQQHGRATGRRGPPGPWQPRPWQPRPFPGPGNFHGNEEHRRWARQDCHVPPPPWDFGEDHLSPEEMFVKDFQPIPQLLHPDFFVQSEFPVEEQLPASPPWEQGIFQDSYSPQHFRGPRQRRRRLLRRVQQVTMHHSSASSQSSRGNHPSSTSSQSCSLESQPGGKEEPQHLDAPQPPTACKDGVQSEEQADEGLLVANNEVPESPGPAASLQKSLATDPRAVEQEPAAGPKQAEPEGRQPAADSQHPSALEEKLVPLEVTSTKEKEDLELIEPHSQSVPGASASAGSYPYSPLSPEPAETVSADLSEEATDHQHLPCSPVSTPSPASTDPRSAAILVRKEEIEQLYQQFSLNIAVVATMLLQKEPSMEMALAQALRANLRQVRTRLLQGLEDFISHYDAMHPSP